MYSDEGENIWSCELNSYGKVRNFRGTFKSECPFRYQGQCEDSETGLYYNRFRYYSPEEGMYISQDPIGLFGGVILYGYVDDPNSWVDEFGLHGNCKNSKKPNHVYKIYDANTGEVLKWGISGGKITKSGKSYRAQSQVTALKNKYPGANIKTKIIKKNVSRDKALKIEQNKVDRYSVNKQKRGVPFDQSAPPENKLPTPKVTI